MGSSFSIQSKEKRRRSNRLSKPPQNQATSNSLNSRLPIRPVEQALSLPSTPTTWQNPWTGVSVPISPTEGVVSPSVRSQSFSSGPLQRDTWNCNASPDAQGDAQSRTESWLPSPTSPASTSNRRGSLYRRASFHPSKPAKFQPTTLQSAPQSPIIGQPKRSYSVHSPAQGPINNVPRRTLDRFASLNSYSRANSQNTLPIRRRSLLIRPGVATRKATKGKSHSLISEPCRNDMVLHSRHGVLAVGAHPPYLGHQGAFNGFEPLSELRPSTPSDAGYTHLGTLKLGSLRVVNGSVSPCPSDRTRIEQPTSSPPEAMQDSLNHARMLSAATENQLYVAALRNDSDVYADRMGTVGCGNESRSVICSLPSEYPQSMPQCHTIPTGNDIPTTMLNIPPTVTTREVDDFPASPFSFEKSPPSAITHSTEHCGYEDEGISVHDRERASTSLPGKIPERHLSYSSYASSHQKADSGYSSATSHRTSIDSHASLRRSPGFRRFTLGGSSKDFEAREIDAFTNLSSHVRMHRHLSLQNQKANEGPDLRPRSTSMSAVHHEPQPEASERPRNSSKTVIGASVQDLSFPMYCTKLRSLESAASDLRFHVAPIGKPRDYRHVRPRTTSHNSSIGVCLSKPDFVEAPVYWNSSVSHSRRHSYGAACRARLGDIPLQGSPTCDPGGHDFQHTDAAGFEPWLLPSGHELLSLNLDQADRPDVQRGRTLHRSTEYSNRKPSRHQPPKVLTEICT
ncbi:hypothetical protein BJY01DRAFT_113121 [Aspergillus pseudoustus]|uniref:Ig-like domain-containing protein n=1 Tax=Aspergillus pseudoustus TaxID=1810923 RepID=A0ABR4L0P8_9EURO